MNCINISGPNILCGEVDVQGSKNAALPILAAAVMIPDVTVVHNCPKIADIDHMVRILESIGCKLRWEDHSLMIDAKEIQSTSLPAEYVRAMRCSVVFMGPMLARMGELTLCYPGGCIIGERPIDLHKKALTQLGVCFEEDGERIHASTPGLAGCTVRMDFPSVGATQNAILAAVLAEGKTSIRGGAMEPEVTELVRFLNCAGANISIGRRGEYEIIGVRRLHAAEFTVVSDRIVAGTYLLAGVASRGHIVLNKAPVSQLGKVLKLVESLGSRVEAEGERIELWAKGGIRPVPYLETDVYPGFPTDLQSPLLAVLSVAEGVSCVRERIFENRFEVAKQLCAMGADIQIQGDTAMVCGVRGLHGGVVSAGELRGGAALVIAGLSAAGKTVISGYGYIERGYEDICRDIRSLGGNMELRPE